MNWQVRKAKPSDDWKIVQLSEFYEEALMPYTHRKLTVRGYIDQFLVAEGWSNPYKGDREATDFLLYLGGAVHFLPGTEGRRPYKSTRVLDRTICFLEYIKQVPTDLIRQFVSLGGNVAIIGQVICPGKGSFYAILEEAKKQYNEIWCWMSINGPSYKSYQRYGFDLNMDNTREFWNVYKCDYSTFVLGKWRKEQNV